MFRDSMPEKDLLNRKSFARNIAKSLLTASELDNEGFVTSLTGRWGSGKSTLLKYLMEEIKSKQNERKFKFIEFNPWLFSDTEDIKKVFLHRLSQELKKTWWKRNWRNLVYFFTTKLKFVGYVNSTAGRIGTDLGNMIEKYIDENSQKCKIAIDKALEDRNEKIFVLIDDIDRLAPKQIFEILQVLKLICNFKKTYYIIAFDREAVEISIESQFKHYGKKYLDKIIQADFLIPQVSSEKIESIFFEHLRKLLANYEIELDNSAFSSIWLYQGLKNYFRTLRDVYRFINSLQFTLPSIPHDLDLNDFLIIESIRLFDFDSYSKIHDDYTLIIYSLGSKENLTDEQYLANFKNKVISKLIQYLFPLNPNVQITKRSKRLYNANYFERYFTLQINSTDIAEQEFKKIMHDDNNRLKLLNQILEFNRIENLVVRLNALQTSDSEKFEFRMLSDLYDFSSKNAKRLESIANSLTDAMVHLLAIKSGEKQIYFEKFLEKILREEQPVQLSQIYFLHFLVLSEYQHSGFADNAPDFKEFYLPKITEIKGTYIRIIKKALFHFTPNIPDPLSFYTLLFIYDFAKYLPAEYLQSLNSLLEIDSNLLFFMNSILFTSGGNLKIKADQVKIFLPDIQWRKVFVDRIRKINFSVLSKDQLEWQRFIIEHEQGLNDLLNNGSNILCVRV